MSAAQTLELLAPQGLLPTRKMPLGPGLVLGQRDGKLVCFNFQRLGFRARVTGPTAAVETFLTFVNPGGEPVEAFLLLPLGADQSLVQLRVQVGNRTLDGQVQPREVASERFEVSPAPEFLGRLLAEESEKVVCLPLGMVDPQGPVGVQMASAELLSPWQEGFLFRFPLMMDARLAHGAPVEPQSPSGQVLVPGVKQGAQLAMSLLIEGGVDLAPGRMAATQTCSVTRNPQGEMAVDYARGQSLQDCDFGLLYQLWSKAAPKAWLRTGSRHFLLNVFPAATRVPSPPRDLVVLLEGSDAVKEHFERAQRGVAQLLSSLESNERFALVCFNRDLAGYKQGVFCPAAEVQQSAEWLANYQPSGNADLKVLLSRVLQLNRDPGRTLAVVLMVVGPVGNEPELCNMIISGTRGMRFFTLGLTNQVNRAFLRKAARVSQGACYLSQAGLSLEQPMERLMEETRLPMLSELQLLDRGLGLQGDSVTPEEPGVVYVNHPLTVMGLKSSDGGLEIQARTPTNSVWGEPTPPKPAANPALHVVWAHRKVSELYDEYQLLTGPKAGVLRKMITNLANEYRLIGEHTAYVLVDQVQRSAIMAPSLNPGDWWQEPVDEGPVVPASELLQLSQEQERKETEVTAPRRKGLRAKEGAPGGRKMESISKMDTRSRLHGGMKQNMVGKPMLPYKPRFAGGNGPSVPSGGSGHGATPTPNPPAPRPPVPPGVPQAAPGPQPGPQPTIRKPATPTPPQPQPPQPVTPQPSTAAPPPASAPTAGATPAQPAATASPEQQARQLLAADPEYRARIMGQMRTLYQSLGASAGGQVDPNLGAYVEAVLKSVQELAPQNKVLQEVYRVGNTYYQSLLNGEEQAVPRIQFWVQRFATLF